ncbi:MAG: DUF3293 domain-containing protein [Gemmatimonadaceae bacterium]
MTSPTPDQLDPDRHWYPDTVLHFRTDPAVRVDLREPVRKEGLARLEKIGLTGPFAVLTAHDPRGRDESADVNARRAAVLDEKLLSLGARFVHVEACSPDGSHCEASVAVAISREAATGLAREFEQVAIFWFDGEKFWIVGALAPADPVMLPRVV